MGEKKKLSNSKLRKIYLPTGIFPSCLLHVMVGRGSPPTLHSNCTSLSARTVTCSGSRTKNGFTGKENKMCWWEMIEQIRTLSRKWKRDDSRDRIVGRLEGYVKIEEIIGNKEEMGLKRTWIKEQRLIIISFRESISILGGTFFSMEFISQYIRFLSVKL